MPAVRAYVLKSARLLPLDGGTPIIPVTPPDPGPPAPPPTPGGTGMLIGCSRTNSESAFASAEGAAGPWVASRGYNSGDLKTNWAADACGSDVGKRASVWSAKPNLAALASGALDGKVTAFINSIPDTHLAFVTVWHEPDVKVRKGTPGFTAPAFRAAFERFCTLVKAVGKPHVYTTLILSQYSVTPGLSAGLPEEFWVGGTGSERVIDVVGWDGYQASNTVNSGASEWDACVAFAASKGAAWGIGEIGLSTNVTSMSAGASWLHTQADYAATHGSGPHAGSAAYFCFFDSVVGGVIATPGSNSTLIAASAAIGAQYHTPYPAFVL